MELFALYWLRANEDYHMSVIRPGLIPTYKYHLDKESAFGTRSISTYKNFNLRLAVLMGAFSTYGTRYFPLIVLCLYDPNDTFDVESMLC